MILTRRNFLRSILPAAVAAPILLEELLHPGRVFFLPPRNFTITYDPLVAINVEAIVRKMLARDIAKHMDEIAWKTFSEGRAFYKVSLVDRAAPKFELLEAWAA